MKQKIRNVVSIVLCSFLGVFIGDSIWLVYDVKTHPELYAAQSSPWYTRMLVEGAAFLALLLIGGLAWWLSGKAGRKEEEKEQDPHSEVRK